MDVADMTLNAYLDQWLALARTQVQATTWKTYDSLCRNHLRPRLGDCLIGDLTVRQLNLHFVHLLTEGGRRGGPLSRSTIKSTHMVLRKALGDAVREGRLHDNVAARVTLPRLDPDRDLQPKTLRTWDAAQAARFLQLTADDPLHALWRLALATGMRRGEMLALRWQDLDLDSRQVQVRKSLAYIDERLLLKSTKSGRGRILALDDDTIASLARLPPPTDPDWPMVFTTPQGLPWQPDAISYLWRSQWPALPLPKIRLHDLRHCHACLLLDQGVPIKVVAERLGHARTSTTMDIYAHVRPAQDRDAAHAIRRALRGNGGSRSCAVPPSGDGAPA